MTAEGQFPTFLLNQYVKPDAPAATTDPPSIQSVSNSTAALLPALIGQTRTQGTGVGAGALRDCQGHEISNFVVTVSSTSMTQTPIAGAEAFYFSLSPELPVHHKQAESAAANGLFMVIQLPTSPMPGSFVWSCMHAVTRIATASQVRPATRAGSLLGPNTRSIMERIDRAGPAGIPET